ncbi:MAG: protein-disulfide reductase DsbD domain-containing protein [Rudaea sp.]
MAMIFRFAIAGLFAVSSAFAETAADSAGDHVAVSLIAEQTALVPGTTAWLGVRLAHEPHWHTYWVNPGDSGLPTKIQWSLPAGYAVSEIAWPVPQRIDVGGIVNFGYMGDVVLPVQIDVPNDAKEGSSVHLSADATWLVCREQCIPSKATIALDMPVHSIAANNPDAATLFDAARAAQPEPASWTGSARLNGDTLDVELRGKALPTAQPLRAFVVDRRIVTYAPPKITVGDGEITLLFKKSDYFAIAPTHVNLVVQAGEGATAPSWRVTVPFETTGSTSSSTTGNRP